MGIKPVLNVLFGVVFTFIPLLIGIICIRGGGILSKHIGEKPKRDVFQNNEDFSVALKDYNSLRHFRIIANLVGVWCFIHVACVVGFAFIMSDAMRNL